MLYTSFDITGHFLLLEKKNQGSVTDGIAFAKYLRNRWRLRTIYVEIYVVRKLIRKRIWKGLLLYTSVVVCNYEIAC